MEWGGGGDGGGYVPTSPYNEGPLAWVACVGAGLGAIGGSLLSYAALEQYHATVTAYNVARVRYDHASTPSERAGYSNDLQVAEQNLNAMTYALAGSGLVTVGAFMAVVTLCSPSILFPTP
jgi:hypothetical protein